MIGVVETYGREDTEAQVRDLEIVPKRRVEYRGVTLEEMDVDGIVRRKPQVCIVDELAHSNVPGSRNNIIDARRPSAEYQARNAAVLDWLAAGFRQAREQQLPAIVIFMHADPGLEKAVRGKAGTGYGDLLKLLVEETRNFKGQVLLVHGDTHYHRIDKPLGDPASGKTLANFTRLETYGSPFMGWIEVTADTSRPGIFGFKSRPFSLTTQDH